MGDVLDFFKSLSFWQWTFFTIAFMGIGENSYCLVRRYQKTRKIKIWRLIFVVMWIYLVSENVMHIVNT